MRRLPRARGPQAVGQDREQALPGLRIASGVLHGSGDAHARLVALSSADRVSTANKAVGVGGGTRRSLERAVTLGDGWMPSFRLPADRVAQMLATVDPPEGFTVALAVVPPVNPIGDPSGARAALDERARLGADVAVVGVPHTSLGEFLEQLDALSRLAPEMMTAAPAH